MLSAISNFTDQYFSFSSNEFPLFLYFANFASYGIKRRCCLKLDSLRSLSDMKSFLCLSLWLDPLLFSFFFSFFFFFFLFSIFRFFCQFHGRILSSFTGPQILNSAYDSLWNFDLSTVDYEIVNKFLYASSWLSFNGLVKRSSRIFMKRKKNRNETFLSFSCKKNAI